MKKAPKLFHKNFEFKNKWLSIIFFRRVYIPYKKFKIDCSKTSLKFNNNFYNFSLAILGWDIISIGIIT